MSVGFVNRNSKDTNLCKKPNEMAVALESVEEDEPDFVYNVDSRYLITMTKEELDKVRSMSDFLSLEEQQSIVSFKSVKVSFLDHDYKSIISEAGQGDAFNAAQIKLLQSAPYSTNILLRAEYQQKNWVTGVLEESYTTPHITVVPEKEAKYVEGEEALISYLKDNSKEKTADVIQANLQPGKVSFTVTSKGEISNVELLSTSGYSEIDKTMIQLINNTPGKWEPAENSHGEKVDQELVFSFGTIGC
jgi:hypothetical protein